MRALFTTLLILSLTTLAACGSTPNQLDSDGLRDRADQETDQVR